MTRRFLPSSARAELLATGKTTVRMKLDQAHDHGDVAYAVHPARESGWIAWFGRPSLGTAEFTRKEYKHGFQCPTPPGAEYCVPEPWATRSDVVPGSKKAIHYLMYQADGADLGMAWHDYGTWISGATMPRWATRLFVRVAAVRVVNDGGWWWEIEMERINA